MSLSKFVAESDLLKQTEIEKTRLLAFYHYKVLEQADFTIGDVVSWFRTLNLADPNTYRLKNRIVKSPDFIRSRRTNAFRLHARQIAALETQFPNILENEEVVSFDTILPSSLYKVDRDIIESLAKQINASYENNIFDGCAVLMRRLVEVLLILAYEKLGIEDVIKDSNGNYFMFEKISQDARNNRTLNLSRNTPPCIEKFRTLGNFSAHKIYYTCRKSYIDEVIQDYRATIEELLHKAGIKT